MKRNFIWLAASFIVLCACNNSTPGPDPKTLSSQEKDDEKTNKEDQTEENKTQVLNDIAVGTSGGVEVYRAFLSYESGDLVPSSNTTALGQPIYLNLNITKGWKEENGTVSLGASERISTDNGTVILDEADLFRSYTSLKADDAKFVRLKAVINNMSGPIKYFVVDYKVWDKNGDGVITGSYKFYIK